METRLSQGIKYYLFEYLLENFAKKLIMFVLVMLLISKFSLTALLLVFLSFLNYMTIYFVNDYFDREIDKKERFKQKHKLFFTKRELLFLAFIHFIISSLILYSIDPKLLILSWVATFLAIIRSLTKDLIVREIFLYTLQIIQFYIIFYAFGETIYFYSLFPIVNLYSIVYTYQHYLIKIKMRGNIDNINVHFVFSVLILVNFLYILLNYRSFWALFLSILLYLYVFPLVYMIKANRTKKLIGTAKYFYPLGILLILIFLLLKSRI